MKIMTFLNMLMFVAFQNILLRSKLLDTIRSLLREFFRAPLWGFFRLRVKLLRIGR